MSIGPEFIAENLDLAARYLHTPVLIEKRDGDGTKIIPGNVFRIDAVNRKVLIRDLLDGTGFAAPMSLLEAGVAVNRSGRLRFILAGSWTLVPRVLSNI